MKGWYNVAIHLWNTLFLYFLHTVILISIICIICLDYVLRTSIDKIKENGFKLTKERSRRYSAKIITDVDYADDIAPLANAPLQAETLLDSLERAATCQCTQSGTYVFQSNWWHLHTKREHSETSWQVHLPREQCLFNRDGHQQATSKGMGSYWYAIMLYTHIINMLIYTYTCSCSITTTQ